MSIINPKDHSYVRESFNSFRNHYFSCHDPDFDEDLEELAQADIGDVKDELTLFGSDPDQLIQNLLIDIAPDPKVVRIPLHSKKSSDINYFSEAFAVLQEAVFKSTYNKKNHGFKLWSKGTVFGSVFASLLALSFVVSILVSPSSLEERPKSIAYLNLENSTTPASQSLDLENIKNKKPYSYTEKNFDSLSHSEKEAIMQIFRDYINQGGKFPPTKETNDALAKLAGYSQTTSYPTLIKANLPNNTCSDDGFYSYIVKERDTFSTIAHKCGFTYSELDEKHDLPILNIGDVIHFNFDHNNYLTKATIYKDNDFYIIAFDQGKLIKKPLLGDENSITVKLETKEGSTIFEVLATNPELKNKSDLWKKVADRLSRDYSENSIKSRVKGDQKYFINVKYIKNPAKDYYEVINVSLFEDKYGS